MDKISFCNSYLIHKKHIFCSNRHAQVNNIAQARYWQHLLIRGLSVQLKTPSVILVETARHSWKMETGLLRIKLKMTAEAVPTSFAPHPNFWRPGGVQGQWGGAAVLKCAMERWGGLCRRERTFLVFFWRTPPNRLRPGRLSKLPTTKIGLFVTDYCITLVRLPLVAKPWTDSDSCVFLGLHWGYKWDTFKPACSLASLCTCHPCTAKALWSRYTDLYIVISIWRCQTEHSAGLCFVSHMKCKLLPKQVNVFKMSKTDLKTLTDECILSILLKLKIFTSNLSWDNKDSHLEIIWPTYIYIFLSNYEVIAVVLLIRTFNENITFHSALTDLQKDKKFKKHDAIELTKQTAKQV